MWLLYWMGYNMSVAVWVGLIALLGVDAETAVFMLLYLDLSCAEAAARGQLSTWTQLRDAIEHGAVKRLRPKVMTVACMLFGLLPDFVVQRRGGRRDEAHRRSHGRRHCDVVPDGVGGLSAAVRHLEVELGDASLGSPRGRKLG